MIVAGFHRSRRSCGARPEEPGRTAGDARLEPRLLRGARGGAEGRGEEPLTRSAFRSALARALVVGARETALREIAVRVPVERRGVEQGRLAHERRAGEDLLQRVKNPAG